MKKYSGSPIVFLLFSVVVIVTATIWPRNSDYYSLPLDQRPFHTRYDSLKPSGFEGHAYGVLGTILIILGVASYSLRKRLRRFQQSGSLRHFLQFHIFVCLLGPMLIVYHTTFKFGGLVGISFWSMVAVVASGVVGRFIYRYVPRNIEGNEMGARQLEEELSSLQQTLTTKYGLKDATLDALEESVLPKQNYSDIGLLRLLFWLVANDIRQFRYARILRSELVSFGIAPADHHEVVRLASRRTTLHQRMALLSRIQTTFHYWHVIHIPFTITMFVILAIHIGVAVAFGYTWIF